MTARRVLALLWLAVPALLLSALVHTTDPDIGGVAGLTSRSAVFSVVFYGVPVIGLCLAALALAVRCGRGAGALAGGTIMVFAFVALAVGPATALGWPRSGKGEPARPRRN